jgi:dCTP deaminase
MLLSYNQLLDVIDAGVITNVDKALINSASIDIRLGPKVLLEHCHVDDNGKRDLKRVSLREKQALDMREYDLAKDGPLVLFPGEFILAHSIEIFNLPNTISAHYLLKSSMARIGLNHLTAGWCDAGWNGSVLTLELHNLTRGHEIVLNYMDKIGQMIFFKHEAVPDDKSYAIRGRYNNNKSVSGVRLDPSRIVFGEEAEDEEAEIFAAEHPVVLEFEPLIPKQSRIIVGEDDEPN